MLDFAGTLCYTDNRWVVFILLAIFVFWRKTMGKKTYLINGKYYIIDDETGEIKSVTINDNQNIPVDDLKQLVKILATEKKE